MKPQKNKGKMDPPTTKYKISQNPVVLSVTEQQSLQYRAFVQNHILKDASFSSYLKPDQENAPDDSEINVFDAKKYFSESNDPKESNESSPKNNDQCELASVPRLSSVSSVDGYGRNFRANSFRATPTASSEASWNSQTGLLSNPPGAIPVSLRGIPNGKKRGSFSTRKWFFCRKCPCSGNKSVQVEETNSEPENLRSPRVVLEKATNSVIEIPQRHPNPQRRASETHVVVPTGTINKIGTRRSESDTARVTPSTIAITSAAAGGFSFPILSQSTQANLVIKPPPTATRSSVSQLDDPPRESLEVFQPTMRKSMETNRRCNFFPGSPISRVTATEDDVASDASSDLFEIESFSTSIATSSCPLYRRRESLEEPGTPSVAATECYAPSEVSIDWSVTTAEGFDRASVTNFSVISDMDNIANMRLFGGGGGSGGGNDSSGVKWKGSGGGGLLSCRHEKAVNVGPNPVKYGSPEGPPLKLISTTGHVGGNRPPRANNNKPTTIASSHSARLSLAFAA